MTEAIERKFLIEEPVNERRVVDVSIAFSRHFGNYGLGSSPLYLAGEDSPAQAFKRRFIRHQSDYSLGMITEVQARAVSLSEIIDNFPEFTDTVQNFDIALLKADLALREKLWAVRDYSFSTVRNSSARRLLRRLNVARNIDGGESDSVAEQKLAKGGVAIMTAILGSDGRATELDTFSDFDVVKAVFDGRLRLPASPGKPLYPDQEIRVGANKLPDQAQC